MLVVEAVALTVVAQVELAVTVVAEMVNLELGQPLELELQILVEALVEEEALVDRYQEMLPQEVQE
jgi:hypothetical protein